MSRVLCLDDSETFCAALGEILASAGHEGVFASNWPDLLIAVARSKPDVLLLDVNMPVLDGGRVGAVVRKYWKDLPIIILSSETDVVLELVARDVGARAWIRKKDVRTRLVPAIEAILKPPVLGGAPGPPSD